MVVEQPALQGEVQPISVLPQAGTAALNRLGKKRIYAVPETLLE